MCPNKVTEKGVNLSKFRSLNALENNTFFPLHGKHSFLKSL